MTKLVKILKYGGISLVALLMSSCGVPDTTDTVAADSAKIISLTTSYRSTFESITNNFDVEGEEGLKSLELTRFSYSGNLKNEAIDKFVSDATVINFSVEDREVEVRSEEYGGYENLVVGVLNIGDVTVNAAFHYTNIGAEAINGIIVFDTIEALAFVESEKITILVKGRQ